MQIAVKIEPLKKVGCAAMMIIFTTIVAYALHYGTYVCGNGCQPHIPSDGLTSAFIVSTVNQNVQQWYAGDTVEIRNPAGKRAIWGRQCALCVIGFVQVLEDAPPSSGGSNSGGSGGSGAGSSPGPGPVVVNPPGGGSSGGSGGFPCRWIMTSSGGTCILIE